MTAHDLVIGPLRARRGRTARGSIRADLGTTTADIPVVLVNGARPGPRLVLTAGVHGGEFVGIDAANRLHAELRPAELRGQVVICPVANPLASYAGRLGTTALDGVNINRVFPGDPHGTPTERMADWLFGNVIAGADAYADLHSGGIDETLRDFVGYRRTGDDALDERSRRMADAIGFADVIVGDTAEGGNSHAAAARRGIPAVLVECGQLGERSAATTDRLLHHLGRLLDHLGITENGTPAARPETIRRWRWAAGEKADATGLWYPEFAAGDDVEAGQAIGRIVDPANGDERKVLASATGRIFYAMHGLTVTPGAELAAIAAPGQH
ncbi:succinylglutamate desuccinylase/aspartoacylase family protein [Saccharopolyspora hirsuta]|uniref:Ethanolamine utilization protein EutE n=1 Tax=Saccharopolyspora hirsuta TaxID=1837 RepID=A0A5M7BTH9_SACHI|nr:succinylglutamate desuccinylase/aspartoacylase family protein [Saccharopolyspora hirsuta]KAA5830511.1 ethanolamine utilization protein EutE [Saccharopolyspora hirsuta]